MALSQNPLADALSRGQVLDPAAFTALPEHDTQRRASVPTHRRTPAPQRRGKVTAPSLIGPHMVSLPLSIPLSPTTARNSD